MNCFPVVCVFLYAQHPRLSLSHQVFLSLSSTPLQGTESCKEPSPLLILFTPRAQSMAQRSRLKHGSHTCPFSINRTASKGRTGLDKEAALD